MALLQEFGIFIAIHVAVTDRIAIGFVGVHGLTPGEVAVVVFSLRQQFQERQNETHSVA